ncbi:hypothetical protein LOZ80_12295 [Paenibacillus sp. HWE-109]|uniref:hypothetical protein n=1 Tax=Paenibacillus sp. HWE-109 TaxID=1306526 RepID=UPI001EDD9D66|nr:hypothetical protein [Paenibacillus sp. HWE-109]UKS29661.1 hypothetical protein LOZ80_12295 [Paenibacillus sp. HWE-109]
MFIQKWKKIILVTVITGIVAAFPMSAFAATQSTTAHKAVHTSKSTHTVQSQKKNLESQLANNQKSIENTKKLLEKAKKDKDQKKITKFENRLKTLEATEKKIQTKLKALK